MPCVSSPVPGGVVVCGWMVDWRPSPKCKRQGRVEVLAKAKKPFPPLHPIQSSPDSSYTAIANLFTNLVRTGSEIHKVSSCLPLSKTPDKK